MRSEIAIDPARKPDLGIQLQSSFPELETSPEDRSVGTSVTHFGRGGTCHAKEPFTQTLLTAGFIAGNP